MKEITCPKCGMLHDVPKESNCFRCAVCGEKICGSE